MGDRLPALVRGCLEKVDLNVGLQSCHVGHTELGRSRSPLCAPLEGGDYGISPYIQGMSISSLIL